jgi:hypothetical protein
MKLLNLKYVFAPICAFRMYAVGYEMYKKQWLYNLNRALASSFVVS